MRRFPRHVIPSRHRRFAMWVRWEETCAKGPVAGTTAVHILIAARRAVNTVSRLRERASSTRSLIPKSARQFIPSDTAVALIALDARVLLISTDGARMLPIEDFYISPSADATRENVTEQGEILAEVVIPTASSNRRSAFVKAKERQAMDFALASVALSLEVDGDVISDSRVVLGGVSPLPFRAQGAELALTGCSISRYRFKAGGSVGCRGGETAR